MGLVFFFELGDINSFSFAAPAIRHHWHLSIRSIGFITSATFVGMFVGAMVGGWFSDHIGRKRSLIVTTVWYAGFSLLNALVWEPIGLLIARLLTGLGLSAMTVVVYVTATEPHPLNYNHPHRGPHLRVVTILVREPCIPCRAPDQRWQAGEPVSETSSSGASNTSRTFLASSFVVKGFWRNAVFGISPRLWTIGLSV
jgi:hypothetical protein